MYKEKKEMIGSHLRDMRDMIKDNKKEKGKDYGQDPPWIINQLTRLYMSFWMAKPWLVTPPLPERLVPILPTKST